MPSLKRKAVLEARVARKLDIVSHFDEACKAIQLHRKWIPDVVFAGVMNNVFDSNVDFKELNKALNYCRGLELNDPSNLKGRFMATMHVIDPTLPVNTRQRMYIFITFAIPWKNQQLSLDIGKLHDK